jgi:hypothetical protein
MTPSSARYWKGKLESLAETLGGEHALTNAERQELDNARQIIKAATAQAAPVTIAKFATAIRAHSLLDYLTRAQVPAQVYQPAWTNRRLPPPKFEVRTPAAQVEDATRAMTEWAAIGA